MTGRGTGSGDGRRQAGACAPADRRTRHRFHWVQGNAVECWEWLENGSWLRPGVPVPKTAAQAGSEGWKYHSEAHPGRRA